MRIETRGVYVLGDTGFFRLQGIKVLRSLQFLGYFRTLSFKFQKLSWLCPVGCLSLVETANRAESGQLQSWSKPSDLKHSRNCSLHNTLIPWSLKNPESPNVCTIYVCMYAAMIVWDYSTHKPEIIRSCIFISLLGSGKLRGREAGPLFWVCLVLKVN